jgi:hypothetical protein
VTSVAARSAVAGGVVDERLAATHLVLTESLHTLVSTT